MNSLPLCEADLSRLESIFHHLAPPPLASHEQRLELGELLPRTSVVYDTARLARHVGFNDQVVLVSPGDPTDDFALRIVMPHESDPGRGLISILAPVSLALLGREEGEVISWPANGAVREMRVTTIRKQAVEEPVLDPV